MEMPHDLHDANAKWLGRPSICVLVRKGGTRAQLDWMVFEISSEVNSEKLLREVGEYIRNGKGSVRSFETTLDLSIR